MRSILSNLAILFNCNLSDWEIDCEWISIIAAWFHAMDEEWKWENGGRDWIRSREKRKEEMGEEDENGRNRSEVSLNFIIRIFNIIFFCSFLDSSRLSEANKLLDERARKALRARENAHKHVEKREQVRRLESEARRAVGKYGRLKGYGNGISIQPLLRFPRLLVRLLTMPHSFYNNRWGDTVSVRRGEGLLIDRT